MHARRTSRSATRRAYTIIELAIVAMIIGILAAAAAPRYQLALAQYRANLAANRVAADLRMIRHYARKTSQPQTIEFNATADTYSAEPMPSMNGPGSYEVSLLDSAYAADVTIINFDGGTNVSFDIYGRPTSAGVVTLQCGAELREVQLDELGNVHVRTL